MFARFLAVSCLSMAAALPSQGTAVFPSDHAAVVNGDSYTDWFPYAYGVSRVMAIYEAWDLTVPAGRQITRIGFRQEDTWFSAGKLLQIQVLMGPTDKTAEDADSTYANNYFAAPTSVFGPGVFALPDLGNPANPNPDGNMVWLSLTTPYTPVAGKNLLVEFRVLGNNAGGAAFPYYLDVAGFESPIVSGPAGCAHSGNQVPQLSSRETRAGGYWYCDLAGAPANQLAVWCINLGPLQTPFPLQNLVPGIGAACNGQISLGGVITVAAITSGAGSNTFYLSLPNDRYLNDMILSSQAACLDFFSPGGVVVSNGDQLQVGIDPAMTVIYSQGSATAASGWVWPHHGAVTSFAWQ